MRGPFAAVTLLGLLIPGSSLAAPDYLALGHFDERGRGVRGHGHVLRNALGYELSHSGAFELVADGAAKKAAVKRIHATNKHSVDEQHWVKIGKAVGATHLLLGEVRRDRNTCSAFAQLVHLETRSTKVTRPAYYDCTNYDLVELAGDLSAQLSGRRASAANPRRHRRPPQPPVQITMRGREADVDGVGYTFYALEPPAAGTDGGPEPPPEPEPAPGARPAAEPPSAPSTSEPPALRPRPRALPRPAARAGR